jgi:hypothetical protein
MNHEHGIITFGLYSFSSKFQSTRYHGIITFGLHSFSSKFREHLKYISGLVSVESHSNSLHGG